MYMPVNISSNSSAHKMYMPVNFKDNSAHNMNPNPVPITNIGSKSSARYKKWDLIKIVGFH